MMINTQLTRKDSIEALKLLTHDKKVDYMEYIKAIKKNDIAKKVKLLILYIILMKQD